MSEDRFVDTEAAIEHLRERWGLSYMKRTFHNWVYRKSGPPCFKSGNRRVYRVDELDSWAKSRLERRVA